jgi:hypothetical protein
MRLPGWVVSILAALPTYWLFDHLENSILRYQHYIALRLGHCREVELRAAYLVLGHYDILKFVGALHGKRARKGIFLTTSTFTKEAKDYAEGLETKVIAHRLRLL